ncbi:MAG: YraN family protein [Bacteroidales bacterium]
MAEHNILGSRGEDIAASFLSDNSYEILERNWRCGRLEVDIIARYNEALVIAEVKTRIGNFIEFPQESVDIRRQKRLIRAANAYIYQSNMNLEIRFDIITIVFEDGVNYRLTHIENAFYPAVRS